ncbi:hypothetical protein NUH30_08700 [Leptospira sp. 85282-16]|uniref:Tetratricopeptide repeat protein n=1 Tax=Leptospira montravelensis TaxID=2484961 RepID=A0ABY2LME5_9LEPT|nr:MULTISPECIES: tetratricopeptide repeat protein [Leptospira]MCT8333748.1 hypothetical protein [Leptospira sp. 85282-16]TGK80160.1 hypothetical protein EHQ19_10695 [Leptospira montravelensis]TGL00330.1 hypothetical protein EHQ31_16120 [Leptospira montravelensis]
MNLVSLTKKKTILILILVCLLGPFVNVLFTEEPIDEKKMLTLKWVEGFRRSKNKDINWKTKEKLEKKAAAITRIGINYYQKKQDTKAIEEYKKAILVYPTSETYYHYANSLTNVDRLNDAVKAYQIALEMYPDNTALLYYNLACVYSRLNQLEESKSNLRLAIQNGYFAIQKINKDPDLENLRKLPNWDQGLQELFKVHYITKSNVIGEITYQGPRSGDKFYLCSNGYFVVKTEYYCDQKYKSFSRGKWEFIGNKVVTEKKEDCDLDYVVSQEQRNKYEYSEAPTECYGTPKFAECKKNSKAYKSELSYHSLFEAVKVKPEKNEEDYRSYSHKKFSGEEPKECDPNFYPKDLEDYRVQ